MSCWGTLFFAWNVSRNRENDNIQDTAAISPARLAMRRFAGATISYVRSLEAADLLFCLQVAISIYLRPNALSKAKPFCYARRRNNRTCARGRARRQVAFYPGWRVRARRDGTHSGRRAWCQIARTGYSYWSLQSAPSWSKVAAPKTRQPKDETTGET